MDWIAIYRHGRPCSPQALGLSRRSSFFDHGRKAAQDRVSAEFAMQAESRARELQEVLSRYQGTIEGFAAALPYQNIDETAFRAYAKTVLLASTVLQPGVETLAWAPRVTEHERPAFEAAARIERHDDFTIREKDGGGDVEPAAPSPDYYPLRYVEPEHASSPYGLDLQRSGADALRQAIASGTMTATPTMHMLYGADASLLFVPVYPTVAKRGGGIAPVGILTFRTSISAAIDAIIAAFEPMSQGIDLFVIDDAAPHGQRLIYDPRPDRPRQGRPRGRGQGAGPAVLGRVLRLCRARPDDGRAGDAATAPEKLARAGWFELGCGLVLTAL